MIKVLILLICLFNLMSLYRENKLVSSSSIWIVCFLLIFVVFPIYSNNVYNNGRQIDYLALIGVLIFSLGRFFGHRFVFKYGAISSNNQNNYSIPDFKLSLFFFTIFLTVSIYFLLKYIGMDGILSIIRGSLTSKKLNLAVMSSSTFTFSMHLLVPCILSMWISSKNKKQKFISLIGLIIYTVETILFGFTRIFLITILAVVFFYEVRYIPKRKQLIIVSIASAFLIILLIFMNFVRCLGLSNYSNFSSFLNIDYIFESTDFGASYRWFDELLNYEPMYINPIVYLKPFFAFVPRSLWLNKPEPLSLQVLKNINPYLASIGYSTAGNSVLGEGFSVFGYFGMFFNCFLWGIICEKLDNRYQYRLSRGQDSNCLNVFYYIFSIFIVMSGQRGDWSQYMTIVLWFYFLPMSILSKVHTKINGRNKIYEK